MPESPFSSAMKSIGGIVASFLWEFGLLVVLFAFLICLGVYIDDQDSSTPLLVMTFIMFFLFGTIVMLPIAIFEWNITLPPILGLFMMPLTKLENSSRKTGSKFYCGALILQYVGVMLSLLLLIIRLFGVDSISLFFISVPVSFSFLVVPAITLPVLFRFCTKGRYELLFLYTLLFPFWGPLMMVGATIDGIVDIDPIVVFLPMYLGFLAFCLYFILGFCLANANAEIGKFIIGFTLAAGVVFAAPTFFVMPFLISGNFDPEYPFGNVKFVNVFSPIYIDIIIAAGASLVFHCIEDLTLKEVAATVRYLGKIFSPCQLVADFRELEDGK